MITADTITDEQIRSYARLVEYDDDGGAKWVDAMRALGGNHAARSRCAEIINEQKRRT